MWHPPRYSPIGIELGPATLRAAQLRRRGAAWTVHDAVTLNRPDAAAVFDVDAARSLAEVLARRGFSGRDAVVSLPNRDLIRGLFEVADKNAADPFLAVAQDIERTHNLQPGTYELAAWLPPAYGNQRKSAVCVSGCTHATSQNVVDAFAAAGLEASVIDSRACAAGRVVESPADRLTVVLDIEPDTAELVLLNNGGVAYQRPLIDAGLEHIQRKLTEQGLSPAAADHCLATIGLADTQNPHGQRVRDLLLAFVQNLVQEARPALEYAARVYPELPIGGFALVGSGARVPLLGFELRQQLGYAGAALRGPGALSATIDPAYAVTLGLALHPEEARWAAA